MELEALVPGYTLPASWYSDPEVLSREQERIFKHAWQYAGRVEEASEPGSYFTATAGDVPVVVTRDGEGTLRAFVNVCRHRGALVVQGAGRRETLQCHYHAWTYGLDGSLRSADVDAASLAETLGALPQLVADAGVDVETLRFHRHADSLLEANWKVVCENFLECYHCAVAHPSFSALIDVSPDACERRRSTYDPQGEVERGQFHFLWPNVVVNIAPGRPNLSIGPILPAAPERRARFLDYFVAPEASEGWIADLLEFDDRVGAEDGLVESVQRGLRSRTVERGRLLPQSEQLIADFQRRVAAALAD